MRQSIQLSELVMAPGSSMVLLLHGSALFNDDGIDRGVRILWQLSYTDIGQSVYGVLRQDL